MIYMQHLQPNTTLQGGKYRIDRVLGQGGFGNTYMGFNTEFEETVAIKEFFMKGVTERDETTRSVSVSNAENVAQFEEQREKFKKEARRLRKLKNEHIVKVHDLFEENGTAYYVMDFIDGESTAERLKRTGVPFSEAEVRSILQQVLEALKEVHQNEIWHLDLKPGNIMLDKQGTAYLIDFGASKQIRANGSMTTSTALCYTPGYAPNEQIGQMYDRFGPWTDIYALGATVYNLLTNKKPPMVIDIEEDEADAFNFPAGISEDMKKLVVWMMQPKRKARPQKVGEIINKIDIPQKEQQAIHMPEEKALSHGTYEDSEETVFSRNNTKLVVEDEFLLYDKAMAKAIDLGLSVKWADCNFGATLDNISGILCGWGDKTGIMKSKNVSDYIRGFFQETSNIAGTKYDIATIQWGHKWQMPNRAQWDELVRECRWVKARHYNVDGYRVIGPNGNEIFLPFSGVRSGEEIMYRHSGGYYWTSELVHKSSSCAYYFYFDYEYKIDNADHINYVYTGRAIRPISEF